MRILISFLLFFILYSCDKANDIRQPVELRFKNSTGEFIDSVFFNFGDENHYYKIANMGIDEITDYENFDNGYFNVLTTLHIDTLMLSHPTTDLLCCLSKGKYTVEFEIVLDDNNEEKTATSVIEDD